MKIAVFVSGRGSNLQSILKSDYTKDIVKVKAVVSEKIDCAAFQIAGKYSIPTFTLGNKPGGKSYTELITLFREMGIEFIVLAGFLKLIPKEFIKNFQNKIINIHPALLPSYGGAGMYGMNVHRAVFNSGDNFSGATVHFVDETFDTGRIIAQEKIDVTEAESPEEIAEKVLNVEHKLLPFVLNKFANGKVEITGSQIKIL